MTKGNSLKDDKALITAPQSIFIRTSRNAQNFIARQIAKRVLLLNDRW
jgi:hypothetical protein